MNNNGLRIVISIDGGGIRGVIPIVILRHLDRKIRKLDAKKSLISSIDLISGTSTGAIISAGIIVRRKNRIIYSIGDLLRFYEFLGPKIFNFTKPFKSKNLKLKKILNRKFENLYLSDLKTNYVFVSYDQLTNRSFLFESGMDMEQEIPLTLALESCSAVPGIFPPIKWENHELIDGVFANKNPAKIALQKAKEIYPTDKLVVISLGTGNLGEGLYDEMEEKVEQTHNYLTKQAQEDENLIYYRLQPNILFAKSQMDNASPENIRNLIRDGEYFIKRNHSLFRELLGVFTSKEVDEFKKG